MNNLDDMDSIGETSSASKESEAENVDAIKKYIEEQDILLRHSAPNDLVSNTEKDNLIRGNRESKQNIFKVLEQFHSEDSQSQTPSSNDSLLDLENEEILAKQAAENLLSLSQNCLKMQTVINEPRHSDEIIHSNVHEHISITEVDINSARENVNLCDKLENNHLVIGNMKDQRNIELNSINISPTDLHNELQLNMNNQIKQEKVDNIDSIEKSNLIKSCPVSDLKSKENEDEYRDRPKLLHQLLTSTKNSGGEITESDEFRNIKSELDNKEHSEEPLAIATSVLDMILHDTEVAIKKKKASDVPSKQCVSPEKVNSDISLDIGTKIEAKDFCGLWHPAQIIEVDCEELEVLVQYDIEQKMFNEWINISSPRLRALSSKATKEMSPTHTPAIESNIEPKVEDKQKLTFAVGERCLARWRDNRRFIATIQKDFENGNYEVMFDDGFVWKCPLSRLYKLKETSGKHDYPSFSSGPSPCAAPPGAPAAAAAAAAGTTAASAAAPPAANGLPLLPAFHTHLFDPTRDYLGSKSERREMKRKLNIKEIFNIGQKRKRLHTVDKASKRTRIHIKKEIKSETTSDAPAPETASMTLPPAQESNSLQVKKAVKRKLPVKKIAPVRKKIKLKPSLKHSPLKMAKEIPEAVASIIGTVCKTEPEISRVKLEPPDPETKDSNANDIKPDEHSKSESTKSSDIGTIKSKTLEKWDTIDVIKQETKLEKFEMQDGVGHEEVIGKIKQVIIKLEDGINEVEKNEEKPVETKGATVSEVVVPDDVQPAVKSSPTGNKEKSKVKKSKVKKEKKSRSIQEKKVKKQVAHVKCQLEEMKKQVEMMRQQIMLKTEELANSRRGGPVAAPESCLLPGEWCCRWLDGQPVGAVSEVEYDRADAAAATAAATAAPLPRRSVQVEDKRLPPGWTKHMVRRCLGNSAGKWDVVLVSPENRRIHTKNDMRIYLENNADASLKPFEAALMDFGIHLKLARRMGWVSSGSAAAPPPPPPLAHRSPLLKRPKLSLNKNRDKSRPRNKHTIIKIKPPRPPSASVAALARRTLSEATSCSDPCPPDEATLDGASIKDGFVYVGSLKVQVIETLLRCPADGCFKNFRNTMLLKMHIKHYHRELRKTMGNTPKVLDLAYARTRPTEAEIKRLKCEAQQRIIKVKLPRLQKRAHDQKEQTPAESKDVHVTEATPELPPAPARPPPTPPAPALSPAPAPALAPAPAPAPDDGSEPLDSPKLRNALVTKPTKRPRVLLPVRTKEPEPVVNEACDVSDVPIKTEDVEVDEEIQPKYEIPDCGVLDFETAISTHTVTKLVNGEAKVKSEKKRKTFACIPRLASEDEEWGAGSDPETRSSYPSCGTPDSKLADDARVCSPSNDDRKEAINAYMYTENGERIKLVRMKREEIINCHCGFREEDGLMVQCELCLCWQHALCHNIQREAEVPEKYTCSICLNPRRGRRRQRFIHDQDRLYEGLLPGPGGGRACALLRRTHELSGNLLRVEDALHAVRVNTRVATTRNHPKLYLWARDWESLELSFAREKLNSEYSDLNVIINNLGKENLPIKQEDLKEALDMKSSPPREPEEKLTPKKENHVGAQALLGTILSSPGGASLDLPISESDLEKLAKSVQGHEMGVARLMGGAPRAAPPPQPEAAIENGACRARLLRHIQRCHLLLDQRLDSIEAQVAELESQDATLEGDETANYYPRTKQTMQMISRDLDTMEELGIVT